jgi:precorrin-6Y C5,15-methyltransferase (decarboxylating)
LTGRLKEIVPAVAQAVEAQESVVILASGDPMYFGIGGYLVNKLKKNHIIPNVITAPNAISVAAARFGIKWDDAHVVSAHGRQIPNVTQLIKIHGKIALYTDAINTPAVIGTKLVDSGILEGCAYLAEALGTERERLRTLTLPELSTTVNVDPLNVLIITADKFHSPTIPFDEDASFDKKMPKKGLITKREIRVLSIASLGVGSGDVCWDIGAGSGAVSIDMARCGAKSVWAIEKNLDGCEIVQGNVNTFGVENIHIIHNKAPEGLDELPDPDRVFIGGSGGNMAVLIDLVQQRIRPNGCLVINVATVENLYEALATLRTLGVVPECLQVQVSRSKQILGRLTRFEPLNPVTIIKAVFPQGDNHD